MYSSLERLDYFHGIISKHATVKESMSSEHRFTSKFSYNGKTYVISIYITNEKEYLIMVKNTDFKFISSLNTRYISCFEEYFITVLKKIDNKF